MLGTGAIVRVVVQREPRFAVPAMEPELPSPDQFHAGVRSCARVVEARSPRSEMQRRTSQAMDHLRPRLAPSDPSNAIEDGLEVAGENLQARISMINGLTRHTFYPNGPSNARTALARQTMSGWMGSMDRPELADGRPTSKAPEPGRACRLPDPGKRLPMLDGDSSTWLTLRPLPNGSGPGPSQSPYLRSMSCRGLLRLRDSLLRFQPLKCGCWSGNVPGHTRCPPAGSHRSGSSHR